MSEFVRPQSPPSVKINGRAKPGQLVGHKNRVTWSPSLGPALKIVAHEQEQERGFITGERVGLLFHADLSVDDLPALQSFDLQNEDGVTVASFMTPHSGQWVASWSQGQLASRKKNPAIRYRCEFEVKDVSSLTSAVLVTSARGIYTAWVNGAQSSDSLFRPGFSSYRDRHAYQVEDVQTLIRSGRNAICAEVTDGWWRGKFGLVPKWNIFGTDNAFLCELHLRYKDGTQKIIASGSDFLCTTDGPVRENSFSGGEVYDASSEMQGWRLPNFSTSHWRECTGFESPGTVMVPQEGPSVKLLKTIEAKDYWQVGPQSWVFKFDENVGGIPSVKFQTNEQAVKLIYGEVLDQDRKVTLKNFMFARQTATYIPSIPGEIVHYTPRHLSSGFQYLQIDNLKTPPNLTDVKALVFMTDLYQSGNFESSNNDWSEFWQMFLRSQRGNFIEIPTDCPQREKLGWVDLWVYLPASIGHIDMWPRLRTWLQDMRADQVRLGRMDNTVPSVHSWKLGPIKLFGSAGWDHCAIALPWLLYREYGDPQILEDNWDLLSDYVDDICSRAQKSGLALRKPKNLTGKGRRAKSPFIFDSGFQFGDWLHPDQNSFPKAMLKNALEVPGWLTTAILADAVALRIEVAKILDKPRILREDEQRLKNIRKAYTEWFVRDNGMMLPHAQGPYIAALYYGALEKDVEPYVASQLAKLVEADEFAVRCGFLTSGHLPIVLSRHGYSELAHNIVKRREFPNWLHMVEMGSSTLWEMFVSIDKNGKFIDGSLNHANLGSVCRWMHEHYIGLRQTPGTVGWTSIIIEPEPGDEKSAAIERRTPHGDLRVAWSISGGKMQVSCSTPEGVTVEFISPDGWKLSTTTQPTASSYIWALEKIGV